MEKDFHFAVTYVIGRLAGFKHEDSLIISTSAQYVDDTVNEGTITFKTGESYRRMSSAHEKTNPKIIFSYAERSVWVPFHFLPAAEFTPARPEEQFYDTLVCRPNSPVAQEMLKVCIQKKNSVSDLHRLGVTAHVLVDTWAHQGFAGITHVINKASGIKLLNIDPGTPMDRFNRSFSHLKRVYKAQGLHSLLSRFVYNALSKLQSASLSWIFPMGHGAVLHYPDWPFLEWSYINGHGIEIKRNNTAEFMAAADELFSFFLRYQGTSDGSQKIPAADRKSIEDLLTNIQDEDGETRCERWIVEIKAGRFSFGAAEISYHAKGNRSWKALALQGEQHWYQPFKKFDYSKDFVNSNWKLFHDAIQAHQFDMLHEVLPKFGICLL